MCCWRSGATRVRRTFSYSDQTFGSVPRSWSGARPPAREAPRFLSHRALAVCPRPLSVRSLGAQAQAAFREQLARDATAMEAVQGAIWSWASAPALQKIRPYLAPGLTRWDWPFGTSERDRSRSRRGAPLLSMLDFPGGSPHLRVRHPSADGADRAAVAKGPSRRRTGDCVDSRGEGDAAYRLFQLMQLSGFAVPTVLQLGCRTAEILTVMDYFPQLARRRVFRGLRAQVLPSDVGRAGSAAQGAHRRRVLFAAEHTVHLQLRRPRGGLSATSRRSSPARRRLGAIVADVSPGVDPVAQLASTRRASA